MLIGLFCVLNATKKRSIKPYLYHSENSQICKMCSSIFLANMLMPYEVLIVIAHNTFSA
jgi:hypothetical protein